MELMVISPPGYFEGEGGMINRLFELGLQRLHIRKPVNNAALFRKLLMEIRPEYYPAIAIHQHHELAEEFSLRRLHFTVAARSVMTPVHLDELRGQGFCLSSSVHALQELTGLNGFDYVFFGPVFNSISKSGYESALAADFILPGQQVRVIALGGITAEKLKKVKQMNFDGAAVLGALWHDIPSPEAEFIRISKVLKEVTDQTDVL